MSQTSVTAPADEVPTSRAGVRALRAARHALRVPPVPRDFRADIEGMRAIAVVGVMLWHAGVPLLPGGFVGVDVFFVVSGFLMTALLLEEARERGRIDLGRFYARRARRLLPAALAALVGTVVITLAVIPRTRWTEIGGDVVASAAYLVNWRLAERSVDYLDLSRAPTPVQHYWSLAVEEQFYIVWPVLLLLVLLLARGRAKVFRTGSWMVTVGLLLASLALSVWWTRTAGPEAYFVTPTRVYELMIGAAVALAARAWADVPRPLAALVGWVGLAMIAASLVTIDASTPFPGAWALLPTGGTALVILAGFNAGTLGPVLLLRARWMQWVGRISYSLYLWHWPFVAAAASLAQVGRGGPASLPVHWGLLAVLVSVVPAWLSFRYVEEPVRVHGRTLASRLPPALVTRRTLRLGLNCSLAGLLLGMTMMLLSPPSTSSDAVAWRTPKVVDQVRAPVGAGTLVAGGDSAAARGATAGRVLGSAAAGHEGLAGAPASDLGSDLGSEETLGEDVEPTPMPDRLTDLAVPLEQVPDDRPVMQPEGCFAGLTSTTVGVCEAGDPEGVVTVALLGDSHAGMWVTALDEIGRERGWRVLTVSKSSCPPVDGLEVDREDRSPTHGQCMAYQEKVVDRLVEVDPDLVLMSSAAYSDVPGEEMAQALGRRIDALSDEGMPTALIRDVPRPPFDVPGCLLEHPDAATECVFDREEALARAGTGQSELVALRPALPVVDLNDAVCPTEACEPVLGGVVVWRDSNHLSATYVRSLTDLVEQQVRPLVAASLLPQPAGALLQQGGLLGAG
ncbi:acyltransferase family protein [Ornithinimicrobium sp. LYQ121]|uniref:acyltransferase family protein n=1 Tax=Ornithinimicrobium sp. LYQ121 TaxID=3378801 RepID=UPI003851C8D1